MSAVPAPALEYRALLVYDDLPPGCVAHPVADDSAAPHLRFGEIAVVDTADREPVHGEMFVIRYPNPTRECGYRDAIAQTVSRPGAGPGWAGPSWWACPYQRPRSGAEVEDWLERGRAIVCNDGPYVPGAIERRLVGRVVGVLVTAFEEPRRIAADLAPIAPARPRRARHAQPRRRQA